MIDLTEIPEAHIPSGQQDSFELFAGDVLRVMGYEGVSPPGRGADLGKDLLVAERRKGIGRETIVKWLVSCKHKAHSGKSVGLDDEPNLVERVEGHGCHGFIGFYSTLPSSSLVDRLGQLTPRFEHLFLDRAGIERELLSSQRGLDVACRYCPVSSQRWVKENPKPAEVFGDKPPLPCERCGRDLVYPPQGIVAFWKVRRTGPPAEKHFVDIHVACRGACDQALKQQVPTRHDQAIGNGWADISASASL